MDPVLAVLKDHTLYLKHNLNAQAVGALKVEVGSIQRQVSDLVKEMAFAIADAEGFITSMDR